MIILRINYDIIILNFQGICNILLGLRDDYLIFGAHTLIEEEAKSSGYPGLLTSYRKHIIDAKVDYESASQGKN